MTVAIGMYQPKDTRNLGSLLRTAHLYDVDFTFQIGGVAVTYNRPAESRRVPHHRYESLRDFKIPHPQSVMDLVAVELDTHAVPLSRFAHPENVAYLLGSENRGIPREVLDRIGRIVMVETAQRWPLNVATAGAIVLHDRYVSENWAAA